MRIISIFKNPIFWLLFLIVGYSSYINLKSNELLSIITSDGRGYYAYLPAIFIHGNYQKSYEIEKSYHSNSIDQLYLYKDINGRYYNKYFPGVAILQLPFFLIACFVSYISGIPIDGYNSIFIFFYYLGSLLYAIWGIYNYQKIVEKFYFIFGRLKWSIPLIFISTPLLFYCFNTPSFSHLYSFCFFGLFCLQILNLKESFTHKKIFFLGLILGIIFLIRPINIIIILITPFIIVDLVKIKQFLFSIINLKTGKIFFLGFLGIVLFLFIVWKWQSGNWIVWSYNGEGFNFFHPQIIENLLNFRAGLFFHTPILFFSLIGIFFMYKENKLQSIFWILYFLILIWILSSWWCWDYESSFGNRAYSEHMLFLTLPIYYLLNRIKNVKIVYGLLISIAFFSLIRYFEKTTDFMVDQRFTASNYFESFVFWKPLNKNRWNFTKSCEPYGEKIKSKELLNDASVRFFNEKNEFIYTVLDTLAQKRTCERYYYKVSLEKQIQDSSFDGVMLVIDATSYDLKHRFYKTVDLFNDRLEGKNHWEKLEFEGIVHDNFQEYQKVLIYIWNQGKKKFKIRNCKIVLEEYKS